MTLSAWFSSLSRCPLCEKKMSMCSHIQWHESDTKQYSRCFQSHIYNVNWTWDVTHKSQRVCRSYDVLVSLSSIKAFKFIFFKDLFIYLFLEGKGRRKIGRETSMCGCLSCTPCWGPGLQPKQVPWLGIKPETLWFTGPHSVHWATPARSSSIFKNYETKEKYTCSRI